MYITDVNGRKIIYYDDRLELDSLTIYYREMKDISQSFEGRPVFRFRYKDRDLRIPCREEDYKVVLEYFRMAADQGQEFDPLEFLADDKQHYDSVYTDYSDDHTQYGNSSAFSRPEGDKQLNKHLYVWLCSFIFGAMGIDRFVRGQIGLGVLKFFTAGVFGIMYLYDWIQGMIKAYGSAYKDTEDFYFNPDGSFTR